MAEFKTLDASGLKCPMPIVRAKKEIDAIPAGEILKVVATDPGSVLDFQGWMKTTEKYELVKQEEGQDAQQRKTYIHYLRRKA
jgi:tRNA 2-thiouridine synthesizing protein A